MAEGDRQPRTEPSRQLVEIASWRLAAEMVRRHPKMRVIETHPGDGMYDCLDLLPEASYPPAIVSLNRVGGIHCLAAGRRWDWAWYLSLEDPLEAVMEIEAAAGLPAVGTLPASTPAVLTPRFTAAFLTHALLGRTQWECRNGLLDSAAGSGRRFPWFAPFPAALDRLQESLPDDILGNPAYRFWFLVSNDEPRLCLETTGRAWDRAGVEYDLMHLYRQASRRLLPVVSFVTNGLLT
jgi:hypothetical protein